MEHPLRPFTAAGTSGSSLWRVRIKEGSLLLDLHVTGKKMVKFKADLTLSISLEGYVLMAFYPRGVKVSIVDFSVSKWKVLMM